MKIYAPVKDFDGLRNNVRFVRGVGETNDPQAIEWFRTHGYKVPLEEVPSVVEPEPTKIDEFELLDDEPNFEEMTPLELREWGKEHGLGIKIGNVRNREKLLEILRG